MQTSLLKFFSKTPKGKSLGAAGSGGDTALSPKTTNTVEKNQRYIPRYYCLSHAVNSFISWEINTKLLRKKGCSVAQLGCSVAQLVARWLVERQARGRISARHPMAVPPTEPTAVKIWRWASVNVYE
jgi:hypothetical protein